ncbi:unnamed protein product [Calypogeia fissa]
MATSTAFASTTSAVVAAPARGDASRLSSSSSFRPTSMVQFAPLRTTRSQRVVAARAALSEDSKTIERDVIVSIIAAGAALGFGVSVVDGAFANPIEVAENKVTATLDSATNATPFLPDAPNPGVAVEDARKGVENIASDIGGRIDGVSGKDRPGPVGRNSVASTNGGTGGAIGDAKKRISSFGKNPIAENIQKGSEETTRNIASASPKPNAQRRVDEATKRVGSLGSDLQNKGKDALYEGKNFLGDNVQGKVPSFPELFPKVPETPGLSIPSSGKLEELKSGVQSKAEEAKKAAENALPQ